MSENNISALRNTMFEVLSELKNADESQLDAKIRKAEAMGKVAQTIVNATVVELKHAEIFGGSANGVVRPLEKGVVGVTKHICRWGKKYHEQQLADVVRKQVSEELGKLVIPLLEKISQATAEREKISIGKVIDAWAKLHD